MYNKNKFDRSIDNMLVFLKSGCEIVNSSYKNRPAMYNFLLEQSSLQIFVSYPKF